MDGSRRLPDSRLHTGDLAARTQWLRANIPARAVVMSEQAATDYVYGDRNTVPQPESFSSAADLEDFLLRKGINYVLVGPKSAWQALYTPVYSRSTTRLLPLLDELVTAGRVAPAYSAGAAGIDIYRVEP